MHSNSLPPGANPPLLGGRSSASAGIEQNTGILLGIIMVTMARLRKDYHFSTTTTNRYSFALP